MDARQALVLAGGLGVAQASAAHVEDLVEEAEQMNEVIREFEALRMAQTTGNLKTAAARAGGALAKEAFIGGLVGGLGATAGSLLRGTGKLMNSAGRMGNTFRFQEQARRLGVTPVAPAKPPGMFSSGTSRLQAAAGPGTVPAAPGGWRTPLRAAGVRLQQAGNTVSRGSQTFQHNATIGAPGKPLISGMTQAKMLGGGALLGAGYLGMKGLQATRDFMIQPQHASVYGQGGPGLRQGVSEYGY